MNEAGNRAVVVLASGAFQADLKQAKLFTEKKEALIKVIIFTQGPFSRIIPD